MVMKHNKMAKNLFQSIRRSIGRYIAIALIIALGSALFVGLRATKADMVATAQIYTDEQNMFDIRMLSSYGWGREQVEDISRIDGLQDVEGVFYKDLIVDGGSEGETVYRFYAIPENINRLVLVSGRMPENPQECLADGYRNDDSVLGAQVVLAEENDEASLEEVRYRTFTVVGRVSTPLYMDNNRGSTSVGSGSIQNYYFLPADAFDADYYTEIHATIPGDYAIYSQEYDDAMEAAADRLEELLKPLAQERLDFVRQEAEKEYRDGLQEYEDGLREYEDGKQEAEQKLHDGYQELLDAKDTLRRSQRKLEDAQEQIAQAKITIQQTRQTLADSRKTLADSRAAAYEQISDASATLLENYQTVSKSLRQVEDGLLEIAAKQIEVSTALTQLEILVKAENVAVQAAQTALDLAQQTGADQETLDKLQAALDQVIAKRDEHAAQLEQARAGKAELDSKQAELEAAKTQLRAAMDTIEEGFLELNQQQAAMERQLAAAEAQISAGEAQVTAYEMELPEQEKQIADGWAELADGIEEYHQGIQDYKDGKAEVKAELLEAEMELQDAGEKLHDARETIDGMVKNDVIVLDRNSNIGYTSLDSSSNIVAGVSRVFPVFFILVAALVCITTMTRMVDEERTQIGTLKALGYGNGAIILKYLVYAGSSAVLGCGIGVAAGCTVFPQIIWEAYKIIIYITPRITLTYDWVLSGAVFITYTAAMLLVTWHATRMSLQEVPAELIRPKSPAAGRRLLFERLPVWSKVSFLNKVTIRNIFRYHQRLAMMLLGIGGCTALLLTGFGLRDTIANVADNQFEKVTLYDMEVSFQEGQSVESQEAFLKEITNQGDRAMFLYRSSIELDAGGGTSEITLAAAGSELAQFQNFRKGSTQLPFPENGETLLSVGVAEQMGIRVGDTVTLRDSDMRTIEAVVSGIYDNYVYNYAVVNTQTLENQWEEVPDSQMAYIAVGEGRDPYIAGAKISSMDGVMNVTINQELSEMVRGMMDALDLVVGVVVFCAGLLGVVVLYNLTNININERIREIATIKVLGFKAGETAMYVFKENLALTAMGTVVGLLLGKLLLRFVISQIRMNFVWFQPELLPLSYVWSVVLTALAALAVALLFYFRLDKINMAEALKSVE